jgi:UDP-3-O-acyl N-acetylglucosamine deacetylase
MKQNTIKNSIAINGIGLHTGKEASIKFNPSAPSTGITFIRTDLSGHPKIMADLENITSTVRGTNLGNIHTVEHVLSALYALSITNIEIELDSPEPPALDGSAKGYCELFKKAGIFKQNGDFPVIKLRAPLVIRDNEKAIIAIPDNSFKITFMINYAVPFIGTQVLQFKFDENRYLKEIAPARTYGFMNELEALKSKGLALGASTENAVAIDNNGYVNEPRFHDELVRHKALDLIGDLSLMGAEIKAHIICIRSGHAMNIAFAKKLKEVG